MENQRSPVFEVMLGHASSFFKSSAIRHGRRKGPVCFAWEFIGGVNCQVSKIGCAIFEVRPQKPYLPEN
jgi:hypothetical protein